MERRDWAMIIGFTGTILTILVVFFAGLQTMNSRFEAIDRRFEAIDRRFEAIDGRFEAIDGRLLSIEEHLRSADSSPIDTATAGKKSIL